MKPTIPFAKMNRQLEWNDLRIVLAVADAGTLSGAGRKLGCSHATVFRRLGEIETRLGVKLFERLRKGYAPTAAGDETAAAARLIEQQVFDVERRIAGRDRRPSGTVRITTTDTLFVGLLSPVLVDFQRSYRDIELEVVISNELFSLAKREADVAVRPTHSPPETLVGSKIGAIAQAVYVAADLLPSAGAPLDLQEFQWVGPDERMAYRALEQWMAKENLDRLCTLHVDTVFGIFAAARDGAGAAVLPCYLADSEPRLVRIGEPVSALATDLWLLTHQDLRKTARIQACMSFLADAVKARRAMLSGERHL